MFMGTAPFAVPTLRGLVEAGHTVLMVVTQPDRPAGRGLKLLASAVKTAALELGLDVFQPARVREPDAVQRVHALRPDLLVVVAYGQIIPPPLLAAARLGPLNLHASLLPRHRGAAPIAWAILAGDQESGVTVMQMDPGVDTGPILSQAVVPIDPTETTGSLEEKLAAVGSATLTRTIDEVVRGKARPVPQPTAGVTYAPRLSSEDGKLNLEMSAQEIDRRVRALTPNPGCWLRLPLGEVKVWSGHLAEGSSQEGFAVQTADGIYLLDEVQAPGGRRMPAAAWARGRR